MEQLKAIQEQLDSGSIGGKAATKKPISDRVKEAPPVEGQMTGLVPQNTGQKSSSWGFYAMIIGYVFYLGRLVVHLTITACSLQVHPVLHLEPMKSRWPNLERAPPFRFTSASKHVGRKKKEQPTSQQPRAQASRAKPLLHLGSNAAVGFSFSSLALVVR